MCYLNVKAVDLKITLPNIIKEKLVYICGLAASFWNHQEHIVSQLHNGATLHHSNEIIQTSV